MANSHSPRAKVTSRKAVDRRGFLKGGFGPDGRPASRPLFDGGHG